MVAVADIRRLALTLPEVTVGDDPGDPGCGLGKKGLAWRYLARAAPKARRLPVPGVVAIRCDLARKEMLLEAAPDRFFDDDHYRGYPAVLARHRLIDEAEMAGLLAHAWRLASTPTLAKRHPQVG